MSSKRIFAILSRELYSYFASPTAYIIIVVFLLIAGWFFSSTIFLIGEATLDGFLTNLPLIFVFLMPAISMKLLAEEYKEGTIEILSTQPLKDEEILIGKYISSIILLSVILLETLIHPVSLSFVGKLDWGKVIGTYIGLFLLGSFYLSIGLFASSLTNTQVVSFIIGFLFCFIFFLIGKILNFFPGILGFILNYIGTDSHFENITKGILDSRDIIYYISFILLFLILTLSLIKKKRGIKINSSFNLTLIGILVLINYFSIYFFVRVDLTKNHIYSLSQSSKKIIKNLKEPVYLKVYFNKNVPANYATLRKYLRDLLQEYRSYSSRNFKFEFLNPEDNEDVRREARRAGIYPVQFTEIKKDKYEVKEGYMGIVLYYQDKKETIPYLKDTQGLEYIISSTIKKLIQEKKMKIGFLKGHDEKDLTDTLKDYLRRNYEIYDVNIKDKKLDKDVDALVVIGPEREFTEDDISVLNQFVDENKNIGLFISKYKVPLDSFWGKELKTKITPFLKNLGINLKDGLICEPPPYCQRIGIQQKRGFLLIQNIVEYPFFPVISNFKEGNPITRGLERVTLPFVSPIEISSKTADGILIAPFLFTSKYSWLRKNTSYLNPLQNIVPQKDDERGPFTVGVTIKKENAGRIVVIPSSDFISERFSEDPANSTLFYNILDWLAEDEDLISIRSKGISYNPIKKVSDTARIVFKYINMFLGPIIIVILGLLFWKRERIKREILSSAIL